MSSIDSLASSTVANASSASADTVKGQASMLMLKKAMQQQESTAAQLIQSLPQQPSLASSGQLGTQLNVYA